MSYFIYVFLDPRKPGHHNYSCFASSFEPYYVGKGKARRIEKHFFDCEKTRCTNRIKLAKIHHIREAGFNPKEYALVVKNDLTERQALDLEIALIAEIGRIHLKTGPLSNLTEGGEGVSGMSHPSKGKSWEEIIGVEKAQAFRKEMSEKRKGAGNPMWGRAAYSRGKKMSAAYCANVRRVSAHPVKQLAQDGALIKVWPSIREASETLKVSYAGISQCVSPKGVNRLCGGFQWEYVDRPNPKLNRKDKRFKVYQITFADGRQEIVRNISEFARQHGVQVSVLSSLAHGKITHSRWKCEIIADPNNSICLNPTFMPSPQLNAMAESPRII